VINIPNKFEIHRKNKTKSKYYYRMDHNVKTKDGWITVPHYIGIDPTRTDFRKKVKKYIKKW